MVIFSVFIGIGIELRKWGRQADAQGLIDPPPQSLGIVRP